MKTKQIRIRTERVSVDDHHLLLHLTNIIVFAFFNIAAFAGVQSNYYVSPSGNDTSQGTLAHPFATIEKARDIVRTVNGNMTGDIFIYLRGGTYELTSSFILTPADGGTNGYNIIYKAYNCDNPLISGGVKIIDWTLHDTAENIYKSAARIPFDTRQLYVNGIRAVRARSIDGSGWGESGNGYDCPVEISTWKNIKNVEVVSYKAWKCHRGLVDSMQNSSHAVMAQPYWDYLHIQYDAPPAWIENAFELLDSEGEWYLDPADSTVYYKPREGEDMATVEIILPRLDTLVYGTGVSNIQFRGITFAYSTWKLPENSGFPCKQADALYNGLNHEIIQVPGALSFDYSNNIKFESNAFKHLGKTAIRFYTGCKNNCIYYNVFDDISGSAISIGGLTNPNPSVSDIVKDNIVDNNAIRNVAIEYKSSVGIFIGYSEHTTITHNEISNLPYTGISAGWGWNNITIAGKNNEISFNHIDSVMMVLDDGGGIYTLSSQPGAQIHDNYISHGFNDYTALYPDQGSSNMHWHHNVLRAVPRWLHMWTSSIENDTVDFNYYDNATQTTNGTNCVIRNNVFVSDGNWPVEAINIMKYAGRTAILNKLTGISVTPESAVLHIKDSLQLAVNITSCDSVYTDVQWVSSDPGVADVSSKGVIIAKSAGNVKITVSTMYNSKIDSLEVSVIAPAGISDNLFEPDLFYPNPATDKLTMNNLLSGNAQILLFDIQGKLVSKNQVRFGEVDISGLSKGIYIVKLIDSGHVRISKFVKK